MTITYHINDSTLDANILDGLQALHKTIFDESDDLSSKMTGKPPLVIVTAMDGERVIGYEIGYALDNRTFYSWLGGVDPRYRNQGIAYSLRFNEKAASLFKRNRI
ncbi:GNAT family N-acetyltransferase [Oceanobacillus jordanicus]|uniref:GNAT family N-acetyltransferase n=1 Tax=Oceanobacillus jordanicus TaxID=2867266 RepID=UPI001EDDC604|nr:GNAT family N-acetyltransferase [Oceanobacillus jordanicus]